MFHEHLYINSTWKFAFYLVSELQLTPCRDFCNGIYGTLFDVIKEDFINEVKRLLSLKFVWINQLWNNGMFGHKRHINDFNYHFKQKCAACSLPTAHFVRSIIINFNLVHFIFLCQNQMSMQASLLFLFVPHFCRYVVC